MPYWDDPKRIRLEDCKHRGLYKLVSRNITLGVYNEKSRGFCGIREKFGSRYVFEEYHVDYPGPYGTAVPMELLPETLPAELEPIEYFPGYACSECGKACEYARWPEGGEREIKLDGGGTVHVPGQWQHLDGMRCPDMGGIMRPNEPLFRWLEEMEKKYLTDSNVDVCRSRHLHRRLLGFVATR